MFVLIAQGPGFYGAAFCTVEMTFGQIQAKLASLDCHFDEKNQAGSVYVAPDTLVLVHSWAGNAQPDPIVLFDTGHQQEDLNALNQLLTLLS